MGPGNFLDFKRKGVNGPDFALVHSASLWFTLQKNSPKREVRGKTGWCQHPALLLASGGCHRLEQCIFVA